MGRPWRASAGGFVYHVINRANARLPLFQKAADYEAFERVLDEARRRFEAPLLAYCLMPNHWRLVVWPRADGDLSRYVGWLTLTHTQRWHAHYHTVGAGHAYQGRFKSFHIQDDEHLWVVCRYVERNALRAGLVRRAEEWRWCSLWRRQRGGPAAQGLLGEWPTPRPEDWPAWVNAPQTEGELAAMRHCVTRGLPYGDETWVGETVKHLGLEGTLRPRGRPRKPRDEAVEKGS